HSIPYMVAAAILDGQLLPAQYEDDRIVRDDVQQLLRKVTVTWSRSYTRRYPEEVPCRLTISLKDGTKLIEKKADFDGFVSRPASWDNVKAKFHLLANRNASVSLCREIVNAVLQLENTTARD